MPYTTSDNINICISCMSSDKTVIFASDELQKYLSKIINKQIPIDIKTSAEYDQSCITVGIHSVLPFLDMPNVEDPSVDDLIYIDIKDGTGFISGSNPRSVLLAVYRYLTEVGCRWVRPGINGECIPVTDTLIDVSINEKASYRHRGVCIEGAVSYQHVFDMIDWLPKIGFNAYFTQFREAFAFFDRWYAHHGNSTMKSNQISIDDARKFISDAVVEIDKRGLIYHAVGHGWTCEPFGISGMDWEEREYKVPPDAIQYMAEVNGVRGLWYNIPLNTNLCYSNPKVRDIITDEIVDYAAKNSSIDILHFWLADGSNNNCECDECRKARPSDFYVQMLNELDAKLTESNINTKIVFLIYVDLLWPPLEEKIINKERFILMFAPITRTYTNSFQPADVLPELPPYNRNKLEFTKNVDMNVSFLNEWQKVFDGDSFDFDYHLMWDHMNDPGHIYISSIISQDMKALRSIGLDGFMSCQVQRVFLPTALPMIAMGKTLWDINADLSDITEDYFSSAFGTDGDACREYLTKISEFFDPIYLRGEKPINNAEAANNFADALKLINNFLPVIESNRNCGNICHRSSWNYLWYHSMIYSGLSEAFKARAEGNTDKAKSCWSEIRQKVMEFESIIHPVLDVQLFLNVVGGKFRS